LIACLDLAAVHTGQSAAYFLVSDFGTGVTATAIAWGKRISGHTE